MHHRRRIAFSFGFKFGGLTNGVDTGQRSELCMSCLFVRALQQWRLHSHSLSRPMKEHALSRIIFEVVAHIQHARVSEVLGQNWPTWLPRVQSLLHFCVGSRRSHFLFQISSVAAEW